MEELGFASTSSTSFQTGSTLPNQPTSSRIISDMSSSTDTEKMMREIVRNIVRCDRALERLDEHRSTCDELKVCVFPYFKAYFADDLQQRNKRCRKTSH